MQILYCKSVNDVCTDRSHCYDENVIINSSERIISHISVFLFLCCKVIRGCFLIIYNVIKKNILYFLEYYVSFHHILICSQLQKYFHEICAQVSVSLFKIFPLLLDTFSPYLIPSYSSDLNLLTPPLSVSQFNLAVI